MLFGDGVHTVLQAVTDRRDARRCAPTPKMGEAKFEQVNHPGAAHGQLLIGPRSRRQVLPTVLPKIRSAA